MQVSIVTLTTTISSFNAHLIGQAISVNIQQLPLCQILVQAAATRKASQGESQEVDDPDPPFLDNFS